MAITNYQVRPGAYYDSVTLMQLRKSLAALPGVEDAGVAMATPANCELLTATGFDIAAINARPDDLLILVRAESESAASDALAQVDALLRQRQQTASRGFRPRSLRGGLDQLPAAEWVLISVPGRYAAAVAEEALDAGRHVFLYSDNVSVADEVRLKQAARARGLLLMGPDCGTAIVNGVGLGFANRVRQGNIGIVAASGTGLQSAAVAIHRLGGGVSQAFGTGGRDLKAQVGGLTTRQALDWLTRDEATAAVLLIAKPPDPAVAAELLRAAQRCGKPVVVNFLGYAPPGRRLGNLSFASGLADAAELALDMARNRPAAASPVDRPLAGYVRGLFSGGTLAYEVLFGLHPVLTPLHSNLTAGAELAAPAHAILDLGDDEYTRGRLHPMLDNELRLRHLRREAADPAVDIILLDVVLGDGSHPDPAAELAPAVAEAAQAGKRVVAIIVGTEDDPQEMAGQVERLTAAGALVLRDVAGALSYVYNRLPPVAYEYPPITLATDGLAAVNVGLESFHESLLAQGGTAVHVEWRPPAGGDERLINILARLKTRPADESEYSATQAG